MTSARAPAPHGAVKVSDDQGKLWTIHLRLSSGSLAPSVQGEKWEIHSIPSFSNLSDAPKSHAVSSCRIIQSFLKYYQFWRLFVRSYKRILKNSHIADRVYYSCLLSVIWEINSNITDISGRSLNSKSNDLRDCVAKFLHIKHWIYHKATLHYLIVARCFASVFYCVISWNIS